MRVEMKQTQNGAYQEPTGDVKLEPVRSAVSALNAAHNTVALYPAASSVPGEAVAAFVQCLNRLLLTRPHLCIAVGPNELSVDGHEISRDSESLKRFASQLRSRQISWLRFFPGLDRGECLAFLTLLARTEAGATGSEDGPVVALEGAGLEHIEIIDLAQEAAAHVGAAGAARPEAVWVGGVPPLPAEALVAADPEQVRGWLRAAAEEVTSRGLATRHAASELATVIAPEAEKAIALGGADEELGLSNLAEAVLSLDEDSRCGLLSFLLTDGAGALEAVLARVGDDELVSVLADQIASAHTSVADLLSQSVLGPERREAIAGAAGAMAEARAPDVAPAPDAGKAVAVSGKDASGASLPRFSRREDSIPVSPEALATHVRRFSEEERARLIRAPLEAKENDVDRAMATLLRLLGEAGDANAVEDTVQAVVSMADYSLTQGRIGPVNRALGGLRLVHGGVDAPLSLVRRVGAAIATLSSQEVAERVVRVVEETEDRRCLDDATGYFMQADPVAQESLMDGLAGEVSSRSAESARAVLVSLGPRAIGALDHHVTDHRWAVAHAAVLILTDLGSQRAAPAFRSALEHPDQRVVEAAIRGLAAIGGRDAEEALARAIEECPQALRILAIREAGGLGAVCAVDALDRVAGRPDVFGRMLDEKLAAVEALAAVGTSAAIGALKVLRQTRFLFAPRKTRRFRSAVRGHLQAASGVEGDDKIAHVGAEGGP